MDTIRNVFGGIAKFFLLITAGVMFLCVAFFLWSMAETWDVRHTDSLLLWGGILSGAVIIMVSGAAIFLFFLRFILVQQQQQMNAEIIRDGYNPNQQQFLPQPPQQQFLPAPQVGYSQVQYGAPNQYGQPQGYGQPVANQFPMPPQPPVEGSLQRSGVRYDLEMN
jgi:hypothetical protein